MATESPGPDSPGPDSPGPADNAAERAEDAADRAEDAAARTHELDTATQATRGRRGTGDLGRPGPPFQRRNPFFVGLVGGLGAFVAYLAYQTFVGIGSVLLLVVVALFLAAGLNPVVQLLERRGMRRSFACTIVIVAALAAIAVFVGALVPVISDQVTSLTDAVPGYLDELQRNEQIRDLNEQYRLLDNLQDYIADGDFLTGLFGGALGFGLEVLSTLFDVFVVVVLTLYFLASLERTKTALYSLAPASRRERVGKLGDRIIEGIGGYVSGAFVVALCAGVSSLVFLIVVGLGQYAVALALVVALLDVIPMIGATIGAVVVSVIGFADDPTTGLACVVFYVIYQQVENYLIYPRVMQRQVDVPGAVTVIAALVGAALLGIVGALIAIPTAAAVLLLLRELVVKQQDER